MASRRGLIAAFFVSLVPSIVRGKKKAREKKRHHPEPIIVSDYTTPTWDGLVSRAVDDFNAVLPKNAAPLKYVRMGVVPCNQLFTGTPRGEIREIQVCSGNNPTSPGGQSYGWWMAVRPTKIDLSEKLMSMPENVSLKPMILCHEMMHTVTGITDNYGAMPDTSCVWGTLDHPGPFDIEYMRSVLGKRK